MQFDMKFDLMRNAQLGAEGNSKGVRYEYAYCWVVKIDNYKSYFLLGKLNDIEVHATDVGNDFLYRFTKENIYIVVGSKFG